MNETSKVIHEVRADLIILRDVLTRKTIAVELLTDNNNGNNKNLKQVPLSEEILTKQDIENIPFYTKGMKSATEDCDFKFTFAKDKNGKFIENTKRLYSEINRHGSIRIGRYKYSISRTDKNLINANLMG